MKCQLSNIEKYTIILIISFAFPLKNLVGLVSYMHARNFVRALLSLSELFAARKVFFPFVTVSSGIAQETLSLYKLNEGVFFAEQL